MKTTKNPSLLTRVFIHQVEMSGLEPESEPADFDVRLGF